MYPRCDSGVERTLVSMILGPDAHPAKVVTNTATAIVFSIVGAVAKEGALVLSPGQAQFLTSSDTHCARPRTAHRLRTELHEYNGSVACLLAASMEQYAPWFTIALYACGLTFTRTVRRVRLPIPIASSGSLRGGRHQRADQLGMHGALTRLEGIAEELSASVDPACLLSAARAQKLQGQSQAPAPASACGRPDITTLSHLRRASMKPTPARLCWDSPHAASYPAITPHLERQGLDDRIAAAATDGSRQPKRACGSDYCEQNTCCRQGAVPCHRRLRARCLCQRIRPSHQAPTTRWVRSPATHSHRRPIESTGCSSRRWHLHLRSLQMRQSARSCPNAWPSARR